MTPSYHLFRSLVPNKTPLQRLPNSPGVRAVHFDAMFTRKPLGHSDVYWTVAMANPWPGPPCFTRSKLLDLSPMHP